MAAKDHNSYENLQIKTADNGSIEELKRVEFQRNERLRLIPTIDEDIKASLRLLKEPEALTDEDAYSRRERLAELIFKFKDYRDVFEASIYYKNPSDQYRMNVEDENAEEEEEDFYTPASRSLVDARKFLLYFSLNRSKERLLRESKRSQNFSMVEEIKKRRGFAKKIEDIRLFGTQIVSTRPISQLSVSPSENVVAAASWAGELAVLDIQSLDVIHNKQEAHMGKISGVHWNPSGTQIVTGGEDGVIKLFDYHSNSLQELTSFNGHDSRVTDAQFHPSGNFIGSSSFDMTWRLWDIETQQELLLQEGHGKELYSLSFQCDGSLVCSGGLDSTGLVWDIRSGKRLMSLSGHSKPIYSVEWSPNGYQIATGSGDGTIKIWDLRRPDDCQTILAHKSIVTKVKFEKNGRCIASSGYDKSINIYGADNWKILATLQGHMDKILSVDMTENAESVVSCGWDRSVKVWTKQYQ